MDLDPTALAYAKERLAPFGDRFRAQQSNFRRIREVLNAAAENEPVGILADLGVF
jgi:16S rRNA (cytosine1402-N4)-methyltransferase